MMPSTGRMDPTWVKALVIDNGAETFVFVTLDAIGWFFARHCEMTYQNDLMKNLKAFSETLCFLNGMFSFLN